MQEDYPSREEERGLIKRFEEQLKNQTFNFFDVTEYETIIQYYLDHLKFGRGLKASKLALEQYPFSMEVSMLAAQCYLGKEQFDEALKVIENAENLHPNDPELLTVKGNILSIIGEFLPEERVGVPTPTRTGLEINGTVSILIMTGTDLGSCIISSVVSKTL